MSELFNLEKLNIKELRQLLLESNISKKDKSKYGALLLYHKPITIKKAIKLKLSKNKKSRKIYKSHHIKKTYKKYYYNIKCQDKKK